MVFRLPAGEVDLPLLQSARIGPENHLAQGITAGGETGHLSFIYSIITPTTAHI